jgi:2-polyprenyl-6-methoxyphenol hydroxylase-like FAD-dependent oxidoreductase
MIDVILVGGGPSGLMLANELGRRSVRTLLLDQDAATAVNPQANATQARTMEHYRRLGFAHEVRARGLPPDYPTDIAYFTRYTSHELARFELPSAAKATELVKGLSGSWSAAELPHRVSQMYVEQVLHAHAETLPTIDIRHGWRVTGATQDSDGVTVEAVSTTTGEPQSFRAAYLVGCDGPRSVIRQGLGIRYAGESGVVRDFFGGRMHAIFLRMPDFYRRLPHQPAWMYWTFNTERRALMASVDGRECFAFHTQLKPGDPDEPDAATSRRMFHEAFGDTPDFEIISTSNWTAGLSLVAERFGDGRIFLAGDAVHLFTPAGGLGYNTAIEDAVNLGWKLAGCVHGWGGPALLASYQAERQPVAVRNTSYARGFAESVGNFTPVPELEDDTSEGAAARAAAGAYLDRHARAEFNIPGVTFGGRYDGSPIIATDGSRPPADAANVYTPTACPGGRAPHAWLADGSSLYDRFGFEFTLLVIGDVAGIADMIARDAAARAIPLTILDLKDPALRDLYEADLALIRPDQIVAWRGPRWSAEVWDILTGACAATPADANTP